LVHLLPLVLEGEQAANLEIARGDIDTLGELAPVVEVAEDLPVRVAVIDDEQLAPRSADAFGHARPEPPCLTQSIPNNAGGCQKVPRMVIVCEATPAIFALDEEASYEFWHNVQSG